MSSPETALQVRGDLGVGFAFKWIFGCAGPVKAVLFRRFGHTSCFGFLGGLDLALRRDWF
jgi:hypothetical protein